MTVTTKGIRHELDDFFRLARPFTEGLPDMPIVALITDEIGDVQARAIRNPQLLLVLPDDTVCLQPWPGKNRTDLFTYTVGQARPHLER